MSKVWRIALVLALAAGAVACGDDSDGGENTAGEQPAEEASSEEFCSSVVEAESALLALVSGGEPAELEDLLATVEEETPEEITAEVEAVVADAREVIETKSDKPLGNDSFQENEEAIDVWVADNCGFDRIDIAAVEYAFEGAPESMTTEPTTFAFANEGAEMHEMILVRFKNESDTVDDLIELSDKEAQQRIEFIGASFEAPGESDLETKVLEPGKYAMVCFVSVGSTSENDRGQGPPHVTRGMSAEFSVE